MHFNRRLLITVSLALLTIPMLFVFKSRATSAPNTCDDRDPPQCCEWWVIDVMLDGKVEGAILEDSFGKLRASLAQTQARGRTLCKYFKDHDSCDQTYGSPRCGSGSTGIMKDLADKVAGQLSDPIKQERKKIVQQFIEDELDKTLQESKRIAKLANFVNGFRPDKPKQPNPYAPIGTILKEYSDVLADQAKKLNLVKERLEQPLGPLWSGGTYGADGDPLQEAFKAIASASTTRADSGRIPDFDATSLAHAFTDLRSWSPRPLTGEETQIPAYATGYHIYASSPGYKLGTMSGVSFVTNVEAEQRTSEELLYYLVWLDSTYMFPDLIKNVRITFQLECSGEGGAYQQDPSAGDVVSKSGVATDERYPGQLVSFPIGYCSRTPPTRLTITGVEIVPRPAEPKPSEPQPIQDGGFDGK